MVSCMLYKEGNKITFLACEHFVTHISHFIDTKHILKDVIKNFTLYFLLKYTCLCQKCN